MRYAAEIPVFELKKDYDSEYWEQGAICQIVEVDKLEGCDWWLTQNVAGGYAGYLDPKNDLRPLTRAAREMLEALS